MQSMTRIQYSNAVVRPPAGIELLDSNNSDISVDAKRDIQNKNRSQLKPSLNRVTSSLLCTEENCNQRSRTRK